MTTTENRSAVVEQRLAEYGITPELVSLPLTDIDITKSRRFQNRGSEMLDDSHVLQMAISMENAPTYVLPRIVVGRHTGTLVIVDGNHRTEAYMVDGRTHIDAYVIEGADQEVIEELIMEANAANAKGLTPEDQIKLALAYAERSGDMKVAARRFGLKYETLVQARRVAGGQKKAERAVGLRTVLPQNKATALNRLDEDQIKILGRDLITQVPTKDLTDAVANIVSRPAAQQASQARDEVTRLTATMRASMTPVGRAKAKAAAGPTAKQATGQLRKIAVQLRTHPSWQTDADLIDALNEVILAVSKRGLHSA